MTRIPLIGVLAVLFPVSGLMAEESKVPGKPAAEETRIESIANLETHISQREQRLAEWGKDIVELDSRIEKRVDELVKMLSGMRDPGDSGNKLTRIKQDAIEGLRRGMDAYVGKRRELADHMLPGDTVAQSDLGKFDERILKRVDQIAELAKSIPAQQDAGKYEYDGASYWNGYFFESTRLHEEEKPDSPDTAKQREATAKSLKQNIDRLEKRRGSLMSLLSKRVATQAEEKLYARELGKLDAYEDHLKERLRNVTLASVESGKPIITDQAHDFARLLDDARGDLREDVARLFRTYDQFARGRTYVSQLRANLAARKDQFEKDAAVSPPPESGAPVGK